MKKHIATARIQDLFSGYHTLLARNGLKWLNDVDCKVAFQHFPFATRLQTLHNRITADLIFAKHELRKEFCGFLQYAIRLAEIFQIADSGKTPHNNDIDMSNSQSRGGRGREKDKGHNFDGGSAAGGLGDGTDDGNKNAASMSLGAKQTQSLRHYSKHYRECPPA